MNMPIHISQSKHCPVICQGRKTMSREEKGFLMPELKGDDCVFFGLILEVQGGRMDVLSNFILN